MNKQNGVIFKNHTSSAKMKAGKNTFNPREGPFVKKKFNGRIIKTPDYIPNIGLPQFPDEVKQYIERMKKAEKLEELARKSNHILFSCKTVFPFDLFPDKVIIDKTKINFITKLFFYSESIHCALIKNVKDVQVETDIFFATLTVIPDIYSGDPIRIQFLKKKDALEARRILQGLILCTREGLDISGLKTEEIKDKIRDIGTATEVQYID